MSAIAHPSINWAMTWVTLTLGLFFGFSWLTTRWSIPLRPVVLTVIALWVLFESTGLSLDDYEKGGSLLQFFLGPSVVALALPLHRHWEKVRKQILAIGVAITVGGAVGIVSVLLIAQAFHAPREILATLAPKSVTSPIGMAITEVIGGLPPLAAAIILIVGLVGAEASRLVFPLLRVRNPRAQGLALGSAAHGLGSTRAFELSEETGAYSGLALCLMGVVTALLVPLFFHLLVHD